MLGRAGWALAILVVVAAAAVYWMRTWAPEPPPAEGCRQEVSVLLDDGTSREVAVYRCDAREGRSPSVLVWAPSRRQGARYVGVLDEWTREGRSLWLAVGPGTQPRVREQWRAVLEAMDEDPRVDETRLGAVIDETMIPVLLDRVPPLEGASPAAVVVIAEGPAPASLKAVEAPPRIAWLRTGGAVEAAQQARDWLREALLGGAARR